MLETSWVCRVSCDRNTNVLVMHDCNTFLNIISTVTFYMLRYDVELSCLVVILCLYECESVDT